MLFRMLLWYRHCQLNFANMSHGEGFDLCGVVFLHLKNEVGEPIDFLIELLVVGLRIRGSAGQIWRKAENCQQQTNEACHVRSVHVVVSPVYGGSSLIGVIRLETRRLESGPP